jgi:hypothetical protein
MSTGGRGVAVGMGVGVDVSVGAGFGLGSGGRVAVSACGAQALTRRTNTSRLMMIEWVFICFSFPTVMIDFITICSFAGSGQCPSRLPKDQLRSVKSVSQA